MRTGPTNKHMQELIAQLKRESYKNQAKLWHRVACDLDKPTRQRRVVNVSRLNRYTKDKEIVIVPGKVLGSGSLDHSVTVAAWSFSDSAVKQITDAKGNCMSIMELFNKDPKGKNIRIIG